MNDVDPRESALSIILFNVFLIVVFLLLARVYVHVSDRCTGDDDDNNNNNDGVYVHRLKYSRDVTPQTDDVTRCNGAFGLAVGAVTDHVDMPDCNRICGPAGGKYKTVRADASTYINGVPTEVDCYYCVRDNVSVIKCNPATSDVLRGQDGSWTCQPRWPEVFGGPDGNDVMVCGGFMDDDDAGVSYRGRLDGARRMKTVTDPYDELNSVGSDYRFRCTPGRYTGGPTDHMSNAYVEAPFNRFRRIRNGCAKYVANAPHHLVSDKRLAGHCFCLRDVHGPLRKWHDTKWTHGRRGNVQGDGHGGQSTDDIGLVSVPHACSPCVNSADLRRTGVVNAPRACVKAEQRYEEAYTAPMTSVDKLPCGVKTFANDSSAACVNSVVRIVFGTISSEVKAMVRVLNGPDLWTYENRLAVGLG